MSNAAQKSGNRTVSLRERSLSTIAGWDDSMTLEPTEVFLPVIDAEAALDRMERCIAETQLEKLDHQFLDGGMIVRFRRKRDADIFRQVLG